MRTCYARSDRLDLDDIAGVDRDLRERALAELSVTASVATPALERFASMRYAGQNYEVEVRLPDGEIDEHAWAIAVERFADAHEVLYGFTLHGEVVELIHLRAAAGGPDVLPPQSGGTPGPPAVPARARTRAVWCDRTGPVECLVQRRAHLNPGDELTGPGIIDEPDSTTFVAPGDRVRVAANGALVIEVAGAG
jgi:N-methylhydantoinase A